MSTIKKVAPGCYLGLLEPCCSLHFLFFEKRMNGGFHSNIHKDNHSNQDQPWDIFTRLSIRTVFVFELWGSSWALLRKELFSTFTSSAMLDISFLHGLNLLAPNSQLLRDVAQDKSSWSFCASSYCVP